MVKSHKQCPMCSKMKALSDFYPRYGRTDDQVYTYCKECCSVRKRKNRKTFVAGNNARRLKSRRLLLDYLLEHPCIDCGEPDPIVLDFDHRNPETKIGAVTSLAIRGFSESRIELEIKKCDIRCSNCHRRKTAKAINSHRWQMLNE